MQTANTLVLSFASALALNSLSAFGVSAKAPQWTVKENVTNPESAYFDAESQQIFVSSVAGGGTDKDGKGWISLVTVGKDGKASAKKIVEGQNAPKGLVAKAG